MSAFAELAPAYYERRQLVSDQLAACVMIEPALCPSRQELPREAISCEGLRAVLALSVLSISGESLGVRVAREVGMEYFCRLAKLLFPTPGCGPFAMVSYVPLYVFQLQLLERAEREYYQAATQARKIARWAAKSEALPK